MTRPITPTAPFVCLVAIHHLPETKVHQLVSPVLCADRKSVESRARKTALKRIRDRLSSATKASRRAYANWRCRSWSHGRCCCGTAHGGRARGDSVESHTCEDQAAG